MLKGAKIIVGLLFFGIAAWLAHRGMRNYSGYCREQGRILSDTERVKIVLDKIAMGDPGVIPVYGSDFEGRMIVIGHRRPKQFILYTSVNEFMDWNPDCCAVAQSSPETSRIDPLDKISGRIATFVRLRYTVRYVDFDDKYKETILTKYFAITNCGHMWSGI